jgi:hypothetical protein
MIKYGFVFGPLFIFIHRTFAEYFIVLYLIEKCQEVEDKCRFNYNILMDVLRGYNFGVVRCFLNYSPEIEIFAQKLITNIAADSNFKANKDKLRYELGNILESIMTDDFRNLFAALTNQLMQNENYKSWIKFYIQNLKTKKDKEREYLNVFNV